MPAASLLAGWGALLFVLLMAVGLGEGTHGQALGFACLIICVISITAGVRHGAWMAAYAVVMVLGLTWAEQEHWIRGLEAVPDTPRAMRVFRQLLLVVCSISGGLLISRVTTHYINAAREREQRFHSLLRIAIDWYWEQDAQHRFTTISDPSVARRTPA